MDLDEEDKTFEYQNEITLFVVKMIPYNRRLNPV